MKKTRRHDIPDITEFTDEEGQKWKQTSTDDLFSMQELNSILESIEKERDSEEIILARIDFQKVNREYYDAAVSLQKKLQKQTELLRKVIEDSKIKIERKNRKLKELIEYIKKLHLFIAYLNKNQDQIDAITIPTDRLIQVVAREEDGYAPAEESVYEKVEEVVLPMDATEADFEK